MVFFTSDLHLGHKAILKYRTQFNSIEEHDSVIFDELAKLNKRQVVKILGDSIFDSDKYEFYINQLKKLSCRIQLVMGNHDSLRLYKEDVIEMQLPLHSYKNFWLSHCPIHPQELRNRSGNIHGHLHNAQLEDPRYFDVGLDKNNFKLVAFEEIKEIFKQRI